MTLLGRTAAHLSSLLALLPSVAFALETPALVPAPREVAWSPQPPATLASGTVAIVLGRDATPSEQQAARLLQQFVTKRFSQQWPIVREGEEQPGHQTLVILGQRTTCRLLDDLCRRHAIALSETAPGHDGYVIHVLAEAARLLVLVGGSNARGVEYGQDTLSQLLRRSGSDLALVRATVRDAPVIPWRGRPQTSVRHYLRPGELDLYVLSRVNFIDLRGGIYAFEPGEKLNHPEIAEAVKQAHLRGLIVYATVNCGVSRKNYDKVIETFREMLDLGADGLWLSFDDKGPGDDPVALVNQVLALGHQRQIAGHLIAITPPKGSYQRIASDFDRKIMAVAGMENAIWFWTGVPSPEALAESRGLGLKVKPGWWHNWPRLFTTHAYTGVPPLSLGWHAVEYDVLAAGGECLDAVMPWGGNAFGQHYVVPVINWWGWNPRQHDWNALRSRIFTIVFGEDQAATALKFDDDLQRLFALFRYAHKAGDELPFCPPRLRLPDDKHLTDALISEMTGLLASLDEHAPGQTLLPQPELKSAYLEPMRQELDTHRRAAALVCPEDWWPDLQRRILDALYATNAAAVDELAAGSRERVLHDLDQISASLPTYPHMKSYLDWWRKRAALDAQAWSKLVKARRAALAERLRGYGRTIINPATMLEGLRSPPLEWGIGRWQVSNRLLATSTPSPDEWFWGDWLAGLYEQKGFKTAVFAAEPKTAGEVGEYAELKTVVPVSGHRQRLALLLYVSSANKDLFSNTLSHFRWAGYRFLKLLWQDKTLWETDLGVVSERGEWFMVRLPKIPDTLDSLPLRLRVEDRKLSLNNYTLCFVGPIRLMEVPE